MTVRRSVVISVATLALVAGAGLAYVATGQGAGDGSAARSPGSTSLTPLPSVAAPQASDGATAPSAPARTPEQEEYIRLIGGSSDPSAVLTSGIDQCNRVAYAGQIDPAQLVSAISSGDLSQADLAIPLLCPTWTPELLEARHGFADGTVKVADIWTGETVAPGGYWAPAPTAGCTWIVKDAGGSQLASGSSQSATAGAPLELTVPAAGATVTSTGCRVWLSGS